MPISVIEHKLRMNYLLLKNRFPLLPSVMHRQIVLLSLCGMSLSVQVSAAQSIARIWDERALSAIRADTPHPPAQARNYFSLSVCM